MCMRNQVIGYGTIPARLRGRSRAGESLSSIAASEAHQMTRCCIQRLRINRIEEQTFMGDVMHARPWHQAVAAGDDGGGGSDSAHAFLNGVGYSPLEHPERFVSELVHSTFKVDRGESAPGASNPMSSWYSLLCGSSSSPRPSLASVSVLKPAQFRQDGRVYAEGLSEAHVNRYLKELEPRREGGRHPPPFVVITIIVT
jgi:hypothetical protein